MKKIYTLALFAFVGLSSMYAQCGVIEIPLSQRIQASTVIFEGKVLDKVSFWNSEHTNIYTANTIEVYKVFKGALSAAKVEIVTEGGIVGNDMEIVTPGFTLDKDQTGIFMAQGASVINSPSSITGDLKFETVDFAQGFIKYDLTDGTASDIFTNYTSIEKQVYSAITNNLGSNFKVVKPFSVPQVNNNRSVNAPSITSFSPTTITAGTSSVLTITGTNFGTNTGSAAVAFKNADDGGGTYVVTNTSNIVSWTSTQIQVKVPQHQNCASGTGTIRVTDNTGASVVSSGTLTITYGEMTSLDGSNNENILRLANKNSAGGYTFAYNTTFNSNTAAVAAFDRAMETWRCATQRNFVHTGTTSTACQAADGTNIVSFDGSCLLGGSLLGKTYSYYTACCTSVCYWILSEMDIIFEGTAYPWNFGPGATSGGKYDFESTALHELGHATMLGHVINPPALMHWNRNSNTDVRTLDPNVDVAPGVDIVNRSITSYPCGATAMTKSTASCSTGIPTFSSYDNSVSIYPNPFDNSATLHINADKSSLGNVSLTLFDVLGKEVKHIVNIKDEYVQVNRDNLPNGIYFYQVKNNDQVMATGKVVLANGN